MHRDTLKNKTHVLIVIKNSLGIKSYFSDKMDRSKKLYSDLYDKYVKVHTPEKSKAVCQSEVNDRWRRLKSGLAKDMSAYNDVMRELDEKFQKKEERMKKGHIMSFRKKMRT